MMANSLSRLSIGSVSHVEDGAIKMYRNLREVYWWNEMKKDIMEFVEEEILDFDVSDWVYFKISPMKGVMRFRKKWKLSPCYVGPYWIFRSISKVFDKLELPNDVASVRPVFHVSLFKKCVGDPTYIAPLESLGVKESLSYEEVLAEILYRQVWKLRNKKVAFVKVLWRNHLVEGATWEAETDMMYNFPHLFSSAPILT
ncbi:hypothetical protein MTR67_012979 [Solanum verrucosum]|uniref:Tf2-1-like SH3-like domain-containing protein n=1 Tax=Solanum verrucosum TaxID=315347 RepID=A0AAF0QGP3_SOLVR|nr:hypothetical protein MTR67_012979 [Solanum verrucosum]